MEIAPYPVVLTPAQLAHFVEPKTWPEIFMLEPRMTRAEWRSGIIDADESGRGLLLWTPGPPMKRVRQIPGGTWQLTARGLAFVAEHLGSVTVH